MILCIESHLGDRYLSGKPRTKSELKEQLLQAERLYDRDNDNFIPLLCCLCGWEETEETIPDYTWDRDTGMLLYHPVR